jgi:hypothetical protein
LRIGKKEVAEKCFLKVLAELGAIIDKAGRKNFEAPTNLKTDPIVEILKTQLFVANFEGTSTDKTLSASGVKENESMVKLQTLVSSGNQSLLRECLEVCIIGAQVVTQPNNSIALGVLALDMISAIESESNFNALKDRCVSIILQELLKLAGTRLIELQSDLYCVFKEEESLPQTQFNLMQRICTEVMTKLGEDASICLQREIVNVYFTIGKHRNDV